MVMANGTQVKQRNHTIPTVDPSAPGPMTAATLVALLTDPSRPLGGIHHFVGKHVSGQVDLRDQRVDYPVVLEDCVFEQALRLEGAKLVSLRLSGGRAPGMSGHQLTLSGDLRLTSGFRCDGLVDLAGAHISGGVGCAGALLLGDGDTALTCARATISEDLCLDADTTVRAAVLLSNSHISGNLDCRARLEHPTGNCIEGNLLSVLGDAQFHEGFACAGTIDLSAATINGRLHFGRGRVSAGVGKESAIVCAGTTVGQNIDIDSGIIIDGAVRMPFAKVGAQMVISSVKIRHGGRRAVNGEGAIVKGDVYLGKDTEVDGHVDFIGVQVSGDFVCQADISGFDKHALWIQRSTISGSANLDGLRARGEVCMVGTHVGLDLLLRGASLQNPGGWALKGSRASIDKDALLNAGFACVGTVDFIRAEIKGSLCLDEATLSSPGGTALTLVGGRVTGALQMQMRAAPIGLIDLLDAQVGVLKDSVQSWPTQVVLEGFRYTVLDPSSPKDVALRDQWLSRNRDGYSSRLYEPLISVLKTAGNDDDARKVELLREKRRMQNSPARVRWLYRLLGMTVGYGYATRRILPWVAGLLAVGTVVFWVLYTNPHQIVPKDPKAAQAFNPFFYTLDLLIPVVGLGIRGFWLTSGAALYLTWIFMICGWLLAAVIVAGVSQMVRKN
jgi:hypothetical protein